MVPVAMTSPASNWVNVEQVLNQRRDIEAQVVDRRVLLFFAVQPAHEMRLGDLAGFLGVTIQGRRRRICRSSCRV